MNELIMDDAQRCLRNVDVEQFNGKTILLTGASGMIGTQMLLSLMQCTRTLGVRPKVIAVSRRGLPPHLRMFQDFEWVTVATGDLADSSFAASLPDADLIVHGATYAQPAMFLEDPVNTLRLNTLTTYALLDKLRVDGRFLFISSSDAYAGLPPGKYGEDMSGSTAPTHPRSCYIEGKRCSEAICNAYRLKGRNIVAARLSLAYGPGSRVADKRVLNSFIERGLTKGIIKLLDRGNSLRTYGYVADAVNMMWRMLLGGTQLIYNVAGVSRTTIADLANLVGRILNVPVEFPATDSETLVGAPHDVQLDLARYAEEFGLPDFLPLEKGVTRMIEWHKMLLKEQAEALTA